MATINDNYLKLPGSYLFAEIARRVAAYKEANPDADIIRLGIGDVTQPLPQVCIEAMHKAVDDQAKLRVPRLRPGAGLLLPDGSHHQAQLHGSRHRNRTG